MKTKKTVSEKTLGDIEAEVAQYLRGEDRANVERVLGWVREAKELLARSIDPKDQPTRRYLADVSRWIGEVG